MSAVRPTPVDLLQKCIQAMRRGRSCICGRHSVRWFRSFGR